MADAMRVLVAGSSDFRSPKKEFIQTARRLGERLMKKTRYILVTGGLRSRGTEQLAVDGLVAEAALAALDNNNLEAQSRIMTILPEKDKKFPRVKIGSVVNVAHADVRMRRNSMVLTSDAVVIIGGNKGSRQIAELAFIARKPLIPLPLTGGAALNCWKEYKPEIKAQLRLTRDEITAIERGPELVAVTACLQVLNRILRPHCFVAMPYTRKFLDVFATIRTTVEEYGYKVIRIDQERFVGSILEEIWDQIRRADLILADLTDNNPNVLYELGIAHALSKPSLLVAHTTKGSLPTGTPFDLRAHRILAYKNPDSLSLQLKSHLSEIAPPRQQRMVSELSS